MWHLPRNMVILKGLATHFWFNPRKMRWPHDLPYPVMMIMSFHSLHETHETYDHIQLRRLGNLPSRWIDVQTVLSFFHVIILCHQPLYSFLQCHHPFPSTSFFLYYCTCHGNPASKWSYNIVGEYIYKLKLPITNLL